MNESRPDPLLVEHYEQYLIDQDVDGFQRRVAASYLIGTLERLALNGESCARRAAVFSMGRMADYGSNAVLGKTLTDKDRG
ncbi:MAG: hypothetical protein AAF961_19435, partial [Planctomycetota bacterium]